MQSVAPLWRYIWGFATKKPAEEAGRVMGSLTISSKATTCSVDVSSMSSA